MSIIRKLYHPRGDRGAAHRARGALPLLWALAPRAGGDGDGLAMIELGDDVASCSLHD